MQAVPSKIASDMQAEPLPAEAPQADTVSAPDWDWAGDIKRMDGTGDDPVVADTDLDIDALEMEIVNEEADRLNVGLLKRGGKQRIY